MTDPFNAPCRHQLDAAEGAFIVPTCALRAWQCERCRAEVLADVAREAAEDMRETAARMAESAVHLGLTSTVKIAAAIRALKVTP